MGNQDPQNPCPSKGFLEFLKGICLWESLTFWFGTESLPINMRWAVPSEIACPEPAPKD